MPTPSPTPSPRGAASVFALEPGRGIENSAARWLASKENEADLIGGVNVGSQDRHVQRACWTWSTTAQINDSLKLGSVLLGEIGGMARLHKPRVEQAGFAVLKAPDIPQRAGRDRLHQQPRGRSQTALGRLPGAAGRR